MVDLLRTKLFIPRPRSNLVSRPRLTQRLSAGLDKKLTLIAAPAGYGKTTLLSEWIPTSPRCVTWLSLDAEDNDPVRFWTYISASVRQIDPGLASGALTLLQSPQVAPFTSILTSLINDIASYPDSFSTVLEDYHEIEARQIHETLAFLLAHSPPNFHLVISTRADPPLPVTRLRAREQLTELRANDLRFTADEAAAFLSQVMGLDLSTEEVASLEARTEGWIAGLQIAALSMQSREDIPGFIQAFSGSHRNILGYLMDEVLGKLPPGRLDFLLKTSILDRLCGPLCEALTGEPGGQAVLENLEQANLFITPLDNEGVWYRYHYLFAEVLRARLKQSQPEIIKTLHGRASAWYADHDFLAEAVQHALAAGDVHWVADLIERERWNLLGRGEANTLHLWLDRLPADLVRQSPVLSLTYAWIFSLSRQVELIEPRLNDAENSIEDDLSRSLHPAIRTVNSLRGEIAVLRAVVALSASDHPRALDLCLSALEQIPEEEVLLRGVATYFLAHSERRNNHLAEAEKFFALSSSLSLRADNLLIALHALANLTLGQITMGRLNEADKTSQRLLNLTEDSQRQSWPVAGLAYYGLGKLAYERNNLDAALRYARLGIESGQRGGMRGLELNCLYVEALTLLALGDLTGADQALHKITALTELHAHPVDAAHAAVWEALLNLRQGRVWQAFRWAASTGLSDDDRDLTYAREAEYQTYTRVRIAQGQARAVLPLLDRLVQGAEAGKRRGSLIEILAIQAMAYQANREGPAALDTLERALALAEPESYERLFLDEGEPMRQLLAVDHDRLCQSDISPEDGISLRLLAYIDRLRAAFASPAPPASQTPTSLLDPLSDRELEVLRLVSIGLSNQEIADHLVIALSTVKTHINSLYGKLGTHRRTQAVILAREYGLLPD